MTGRCFQNVVGLLPGCAGISKESIVCFKGRDSSATAQRISTGYRVAVFSCRCGRAVSQALLGH